MKLPKNQSLAILNRKPHRRKVRTHATMPVIKVSSSWYRRLLRHVLLILFFGSIICIFSYVGVLIGRSFSLVEDILGIVVAVLQAECMVLALAAFFPLVPGHSLCIQLTALHLLSLGLLCE